MSIDFSNEQEQTFDFDFLKVAEDVMETVLDQEGCPYESQVCLVLTDNETIHKTNLEYRQIDRATDVLSFPMVGYDHMVDEERIVMEQKQEKALQQLQIVRD